MSNLATLLTDSAARHSDRIALKLDDIALPYAVVEEATARVAGMLKARGIGEGDRVGIMLPNLPYFAFCFYATLRLGAEVVPMNPLLKQREVAFHLSDSEAKLLLGWHQFAEAAEPGAQEAGTECLLVERGPFEELMGAAEPVRDVVDRGDSDTAVLLYTSGTTGTPKGAELTHHTCARRPTSRSTSCTRGPRRSRSAACRCSTSSGSRPGSTRRSPSAAA
jgi:long-chain acyl-CoA synthetase